MYQVLIEVGTIEKRGLHEWRVKYLLTKYQLRTPYSTYSVITAITIARYVHSLPSSDGLACGVEETVADTYSPVIAEDANFPFCTQK